jgi:hypothetical protein
MSAKYRVVVVGMGKRGMHHAQAFQAKPAVFCFCTLPSLRVAMVSAGIKSRARLIAFESRWR